MKDAAALPMLLTVDEIVEILRTTNKTIYAMAERGQVGHDVANQSDRPRWNPGGILGEKFERRSLDNKSLPIQHRPSAVLCIFGNAFQ